MIRVKRIVYPTDFSSYSNQAYFHAIGLATTYGAELNIVHVYTPGHESVPGLSIAEERDYWQRQLVQVRPSDTTIPVNHAFLEGDPASEIIAYAADISADVIVIGTHGRSGVDRLVMGSVAERVMRNSPCSVLVVKLPQPASPKSGIIRNVGAMN